MADNAQPLTDEERAELEALRAEKAARLEREQAERDRAELEALRAEQAEADQAKAERIQAENVQAAQAHTAASAQQRAAEAERDRQIREARERGEKLMMPDDDLRMPVGQKVVLAGIAVVAILVILMNLFVH